MSKFNELVHKYAFLVLFLVLIGTGVGFYGATLYYETRLNEAIKLEGIIIDSQVYNLKVR